MTDNDNLELKKRSRRRLVGAAGLVLLAAIVLPMVMDQEPVTATQDIQVTIPDRDADSELARPIAGRPAVPPEPQVAPPPEEQPPSGAPSPAVPVRSAEAVPAPSAASAPPSKGANEPRPEKQAVRAPSDAEAARARALLEGRTDLASGANEAFVVQVGAFGESGKATALSTNLKGKGFSAYTEKAGSVTRVRVGPFASRAEAERTAERLRASGVNSVVAPR